MAIALCCFNLSIESQNISMRLKNVSVKQAMGILQQKSGYSFVYEADDLNTNKIINVKAKNVKDAVTQIVNGQRVVFVIRGKNIIISKIQKEKNLQERNSTNK